MIKYLGPTTAGITRFAELLSVTPNDMRDAPENPLLIPGARDALCLTGYASFTGFDNRVGPKESRDVLPALALIAD